MQICFAKDLRKNKGMEDDGGEIMFIFIAIFEELAARDSIAFRNPETEYLMKKKDKKIWKRKEKCFIFVWRCAQARKKSGFKKSLFEEREKKKDLKDGKKEFLGLRWNHVFCLFLF